MIAFNFMQPGGMLLYKQSEAEPMHTDSQLSHYCESHDARNRLCRLSEPQDCIDQILVDKCSLPISDQLPTARLTNCSQS